MIVAAVMLAGAAAAAPTYVVERIAHTSEGQRRVSVFRDGSAALVIRNAGHPPVVRHRRLDDVVFRSVKQVVEETYDAMEEFSGFHGTPGEAWIDLRLAPPGRPPLKLSIPISAVPSVAAARLARALDDVDEVLGSSPNTEDLSNWTPARGDRAVLVGGAVATVVEVLDGTDGKIVHIRLGDGPGELFLGLDELKNRVVRRLAP